MPWTRSASVRRWLERAVITVAALATIATSRPRWHKRATALPAAPDPARAARLVVEASGSPEVSIRDSSGALRWIRPEPSPSAQPSQLSQPSDGSGIAFTTTYLVPRGARLAEVVLAGVCHGGLFSGPCEVPADAFVRIASFTAIESWRAEHALPPTTTVLDPAAPLPSYQVRFDASREPTLQIDTAGGSIAPQISGPWADTFYVSWPSANGFAHPVTITWTAHAAIEGACPGTEPCTPPAGEHIEVRSITLEPHAPTQEPHAP